jgi:hypothetical protein
MISNYGAIAAGYLRLSNGEWKAAGADATVTSNTLTLGTNAAAAFGPATPGATLLKGNGATFTASVEDVILVNAAGRLDVAAYFPAVLSLNDTAVIDSAAGIDVSKVELNIEAGARIILPRGIPGVLTLDANSSVKAAATQTTQLTDPVFLTGTADIYVTVDSSDGLLEAIVGPGAVTVDAGYSDSVMGLRNDLKGLK